MTERQRLIILWIEGLPKEPLRYQVTQPPNPKKAKRTWLRCLRVHLAERSMSMRPEPSESE